MMDFDIVLFEVSRMHVLLVADLTANLITLLDVLYVLGFVVRVEEPYMAL